MSHHFWYVYASDGSNAFLIDLIRGPEAASVRLLVSRASSRDAAARHSLRKLSFNRDAVESGPTRYACTIGPASLHEAGGLCRVQEAEYELSFQLEDEQHPLGPSWLSKVIATIPAFESRYGRLNAGQVLGRKLTRVPLVFSTYSLRDLEQARWFIVSALRFPDTDLRLEVCAVRVLGTWFGSAVLRYRETTYRLNSLRQSFQVKISDAGSVRSNERRFHVSLATSDFWVDLRASAPLSDFALLENFETSSIATSLLGSCDVRLRERRYPSEARNYRAVHTCLLELKD